MAALMQQRSPQGFQTHESMIELSGPNHIHVPSRHPQSSQWSWSMPSPAYRFAMSSPLEPQSPNHAHLPSQSNYMPPASFGYNATVSPNPNMRLPARSYTMPATYRTLQPSTLAPTQDLAPREQGKRKPAESLSHKKDIRRSTGSASSAGAPGPIPASQPRIVETQAGGVRIIEFEYNKKKEKHAYKIRCNVDSVEINGLSQDFKMKNAIYPTALHVGSEKKRRPYETQCNELAWKLVHLNPELEGQRGLIQRAVDSWRNTSPDTKYHSRRVKRQKRVPRGRQDEAEGLKATDSSSSIHGSGFDEHQTSPNTSRGRSNVSSFTSSSASQSRNQNETEAWEGGVPFSRNQEYSILGPSNFPDGLHSHRLSPQTSVHSQDMTYLSGFQHEAFASMPAETPTETSSMPPPMHEASASRSMSGSVFGLHDDRGQIYDCGATPSVMPRICR